MNKFSAQNNYSVPLRSVHKKFSGSSRIMNNCYPRSQNWLEISRIIHHNAMNEIVVNFCIHTLKNVYNTLMKVALKFSSNLVIIVNYHNFWRSAQHLFKFSLSKSRFYRFIIQLLVRKFVCKSRIYVKNQGFAKTEGQFLKNDLTIIFSVLMQNWVHLDAYKALHGH